MKSGKTVLAGLAITTITAIALLVWSLHQTGAARAQLLALEKKRTALAARKSRLESQISAAQAKKGGDGHAAPAAIPTAPGKINRLTSVAQVLMNDPKLQAQYFNAMRGKLIISYGALFRKLALNSEQTVALEDAIMRYKEQVLDVYSAVPALTTGVMYDKNPCTWDPITLINARPRSQALSADQAAATDLLAQADQSFQDSAAAAAGADAYSQYQNYERSLPLRNFVATMNSQLSLATDALSPEQSNRLTEILANAAPDADTSTRTVTLSGDPNAQLQAVNWNQVLEQAQPLLSASQYQALKKSAASVQAIGKIMALVNGAPPGLH